MALPCQQFTIGSINVRLMRDTEATIATVFRTHWCGLGYIAGSHKIAEKLCVSVTQPTQHDTIPVPALMQSYKSTFSRRIYSCWQLALHYFLRTAESYLSKKRCILFENACGSLVRPTSIALQRLRQNSNNSKSSVEVVVQQQNATTNNRSMWSLVMVNDAEWRHCLGPNSTCFALFWICTTARCTTSSGATRNVNWGRSSPPLSTLSLPPFVSSPSFLFFALSPYLFSSFSPFFFSLPLLFLRSRSSKI